MDRTAPTFLPLDLNHVLGTAAAPFSVAVPSADQISADDWMLSVGRKGCNAAKTLRRCGAHPLLQRREDQAPIACTAAGTVLRFISQPAPVVEKAGAKPGHVPNKGEGK